MKKRTAVKWISYLSAGALVLGILAFTWCRRARVLELYTKANTNHAFGELVTGMNELSTALDKCLYVTDPALESALCTQIYAKAATAQTALGVLPYGGENFEKTAAFLSTVGDYACVLSRTVGGSGGYGEEERKNLGALSDAAGVMALNLRDMQTRLNAGEMSLDELYAPSAGLSLPEDSVKAGESFKLMEAAFPELPTLIYDGPFSEALRSRTPCMTEEASPVTEETARETAAVFSGCEDVTVTGEIGGTIPCYICRCDDYTVYVTKQGGYVMSALRDAREELVHLSAEEALACADKLLSRMGFEDMERSYYMTEGSTLCADYEYTQSGVMIYPDLVKVGVSMDDGSLVSFDGVGYLTCHRERELPEPALSETEAREALSSYLEPEEVSLAVIPSDGGEERLCYELLCAREDGSRCLVYVNGETGAQEKILLLLEDEKGTLTV